MFSFFCSAAEFHHIYIYIFFFWAERQKLLLSLLYFFAVKHVLLALTHGIGYNNALLVNVFGQLVLDTDLKNYIGSIVGYIFDIL